MTEPDASHISPQTIDDYMPAVPRLVPIDGEPEAFLTVDAPNETLRLDVSWDGE